LRQQLVERNLGPFRARIFRMIGCRQNCGMHSER
jgi:hypothetical protein